jgi:dynein intermediate chain
VNAQRQRREQREQRENANGGLPHVEMVKPAQTQQDTNETEVTEKNKAKERNQLSDEEKLQIMRLESFRNFFDRAIRITERAICLNESQEIFVNYAGQSSDFENDDKKGGNLSVNRCFFEERWSRNRTVTSFDWNDQYPELLLASYNQNEEAPNDPDGVCLVWNMKFKKKTPEYVFHCQSPVMSSCFAKFHPNLIVGGTYSGQLVLWDNRSHKKTPVQRSPLSASAHTHPIYCIKVVGTQNAHNIITISTDGKLCSWSLDMLSQPQDTMELSQQKQNRAVAVTCCSFPQAEMNNFLIGSEEGAIYGASRHGSKAGISDVYEGHQAPVTGVHCHPGHGQVDFSHLFLSSSVDWTVKLWSTKENKALHSFEDNNDYIFDVQWSPVHPALFATADLSGRIDLWNINNDTELPTASTIVEGNAALNKLVWTPAGNQIVAGDDVGKVWLYDVGEQLSVPKGDDCTQLMHTLHELKQMEPGDGVTEIDQAYSSMSSLTSYTSPLR